MMMKLGNKVAHSGDKMLKGSSAESSKVVNGKSWDWLCNSAKKIFKGGKAGDWTGPNIT